MSLDMLGAVTSRWPGVKPPARFPPVPPVKVPVPVKAPAKIPVAPPSVDSPSDVAALVRELQDLGAQHRGHADPKIAALARKALTAAASLKVQSGGLAVGAITSSGGRAASAVLQQLKVALAAAPKRVDRVDVKPAPKTVSTATLAAAQSKLRTSAQKLAKQAQGLRSKAGATTRKGVRAAKVKTSALKIASRMDAAAKKLLAMASRKWVVKSALAVRPTAPKSIVAPRTRVGDDLSDAQALLAEVQQAYDDARVEYNDVVDTLKKARQAWDQANTNAPNRSAPSYAAWLSTVDDLEKEFLDAQYEALYLIFNDTTLGVAAEALTYGKALVAAIQGLPPPAEGVAPPIPPPLVMSTGRATISPAAPTALAGETTQLAFQIDGKAPQASQGTVLWSSTNSQVASVDQTGLVTGNQAGAANITAALGSALAQAKVAVTGTVRASIQPSQLDLAVGQPSPSPLQFAINDKPVLAGGPPVVWTSSAPSVVTVDEAGSVSVVAGGSATITATRGALKATAQVSVIDPSAMAEQVLPGGGGGGGGGGGPGPGAEGAPPDEGGAPPAPSDEADEEGEESPFDFESSEPFEEPFEESEDVEEDVEEDIEESAFEEEDEMSEESIGALHMLGATSLGATSDVASDVASMLPGILKSAGSALSGSKDTPTAEQQRQAQLQLEAQRKRDAEAKAARTKKIALFVGGVLTLGLVGVFLRKVLS